MNVLHTLRSFFSMNPLEWDQAARLEKLNAQWQATHDALMAAHEATERVVHERTAELAETSARLELALSAANLGFWDWNLATGRLKWSDTLKRLFGFENNDFQGRMEHFSQRVHPDDRAAVLAKLQGMLNGTNAFNEEYRVVWPNGEVHWIAVQGRIIERAAGKPLRAIGTAINIDEQKQTKERLEQLVEKRTKELAAAQAGLAHAAKLSALGEMAGCIAHEINTPLAAISVQSEQAGRLLGTFPLAPENQERALKKLRSMQQIAHRIAEIIQGLRAFARDAERDKFERIPVAQLAKQSLALCQTRFKHNGIELDSERIMASPLEIECRAVQVEQILLNLLNNAFDAVAKLPERWVRLDVEEHGERVSISVTDSGCGIDEQVADKMMQPFFTTKDIGKGTGLGLSISSGLAEAHGGSLVFDSQANHTRFTLNLPKHQPQEVRA